MPILEREARVLVMVEEHPLPTTRRMATLTFLTVASLMLIVGFMAGKTSRSEILFVEVPGVATNALDLIVPANKREISLRIVIERNFLPFLRNMAGLAFIAVLPSLYIVQPEAARALRWSGQVEHVGMTAHPAHQNQGVY